MSEITFLVDARETLLKKLDETQLILQTNIAETGGELKLLVNDITELFEKKLRLIENKYNKQSDELYLIKNELKTKKFDESNFNNVSWIKNQDMQIKERDNKIRELEGRIKFLETKANTNIKAIVPLPIVEHIVEPVVEAEPIAEDEPKPIVVEEIKAKSKASAKKEPKVTTKKPIKVKKNIEVELVVEEPVIENIVESVVEPIVEPVIEQVDEPKSKVKVSVKKEPKVTNKKPIKLKKNIEAELVAEPVVESESVVEPKPVVEPVVEPTNETIIKKEFQVIENITDKINKMTEAITKKKDKESEVSAPILKNVVGKGARGAEALVLAPDIKDLDLLELDDINYYKDKNDNVYQMTEDEDIGIFLGVYDISSNKIITIT